MIKRLISSLIIFLSSVVALAISLGGSYIIYLNVANLPQDARFIVDDELSLVVGEVYALSPYIINESGEIEYGQYTYMSNCDKEVEVNPHGIITVKSIPTNDCYITITDIKRNITKQIKLNISKGIINIFDIADSGSAMKYNITYEYEVTVLPADVELSDEYVSFSTINNNGKEIDEIFDISYEGNKIRLTAIGLGAGELLLNIKSEKDYVDYTKEFSFDIKLANETLTNDITKGTLINASELSRIETLYYTGDNLDVRDVAFMTNLSNVVFVNGDSLCTTIHLNEQYKYYVKDNLLNDYYQDVNWKPFFENVYPYDGDISEKRVIYYDNITNNVYSEIIDLNFELDKINNPGYKHNGWKENSTDVQITEYDIINSDATCIRISAVFSPIKYNVEYCSTLTGGTPVLCDTKGNYTNTYLYNETFAIKQLTEFKSYEEIIKLKKGYVFLGWSTKTGKTTNVKTQEEINNILEFNLYDSFELNTKSLTIEDGATIKLYDIWKPIQYTVEFDITGYEKEFIKSPTDIVCYYDEEYAVPDFDLIGYSVDGWKNKENIYNKFFNLTEINGDTVTMKPVLTPKKYQVMIRVPKADNVNQNRPLTMSCSYENFTASVKYNQNLGEKGITWIKVDDNNNILDSTIGVPLFDINVGSGYNKYIWFVDFNQNNLYETQETSTYDPLVGTEYNKNFCLGDFSNMENILKDYQSGTGNGFIKICIKGTSRSFSVKYEMFDGIVYGTSGEQINVPSVEYQTYTDVYSIAIGNVTKKNYVFVGWDIKVKDVLVSTTTSPKLWIHNGVIDDGDNDYTDDYEIKDNDNIVVIAKWASHMVEILFDLNGGNINGQTSISSQVIAAGKDGSSIKPTNPSKEGHTFAGWVDENGTKFDFKVIPDKNVRLKASWTVNNYKVYFNGFWDTQVTISYGNVSYVIVSLSNDCDGKDSITCNGQSWGKYSEYSNSKYIEIPYGTKVTFSVSYQLPEDRYFNVRKENASGAELTLQGSTLTMPAYNINVCADSNPTPPDSCFVAGTKILMANYTYKNIEDIQVGDLVMTWNFFEGKLDVQPVILHWAHGYTQNDIIKLSFSNGNCVEIINTHGFFNVDIMEYVYITSDNYTEYIGGKFLSVKENGEYETVILENAEFSQEFCMSYSLHSAINANAIAYDMLTITAETFKGMCTLGFKVDETYRFNQEDINYYVEKYGLYTYEEWSEYLTMEAFYALNGQYYKILVGRGFITKEEIIYMIQKELM